MECNSVFEQLLLALEYICVEGNLVRGNNLSCKFTDAKTLNSEFSHTVMKVFVDYDFFTYEYDDDVELMGDITQVD